MSFKTGDRVRLTQNYGGGYSPGTRKGDTGTVVAVFDRGVWPVAVKFDNYPTRLLCSEREIELDTPTAYVPETGDYFRYARSYAGFPENQLYRWVGGNAGAAVVVRQPHDSTAWFAPTGPDWAKNAYKVEDLKADQRGSNVAEAYKNLKAAITALEAAFPELVKEEV